MMTTYVINSTREAAIYGFKTGDFSEADRLAAVNLEAVREMVRDLLTGAVQMTSICVYPSGLEVPNYHKSVRMDQPREVRDFCQEMTAGTYTGAAL